ncbi:hypothetical protein B4135_0860 [Caldibacillus debilis]|jgi:hypothetical protein|uniref:Uncharacterized protein n=1 Tax=Caldibacillus debilis TaxID=301148 RepID=A0A150M6H2_9BACI|nr:hypothetical protein B4135_0860 [Caldibacillus debilis]
MLPKRLKFRLQAMIASFSKEEGTSRPNGPHPFEFPQA